MSDVPRETLADWGELRFLDWVEKHARGAERPEITLGIGDDGCLMRFGANADLVVTTDALIEGSHFERGWAPPGDLARKALVSNLSDLAAMAAAPVAAFLSLGVPPSTSIIDLQEFFISLSGEARRWDCALAGGDLTRAPQWVINLTLIGRLYVPGRPARRDAGRAGDRLYVTGWPGESGAGLEALRRGDASATKDSVSGQLAGRHLGPTPRFAEIRALAEAPGAAGERLCAIDVSDGVWNEAGHLARRSGVAIEIDFERLPVSDALREYGVAIGADPRQWVLFGGEDYELMILSPEPPERLRATLDAAGSSTRLHEIGRAIAGEADAKTGGGRPPGSVRLIGPDGAEIRVADRTFKHFSE